jgi:hypothetical protein
MQIVSCESFNWIFFHYFVPVVVLDFSYYPSIWNVPDDFCLQNILIHGYRELFADLIVRSTMHILPYIPDDASKVFVH